MSLFYMYSSVTPNGDPSPSHFRPICILTVIYLHYFPSVKFTVDEETVAIPKIMYQTY